MKLYKCSGTLNYETHELLPTIFIFASNMDEAWKEALKIHKNYCCFSRADEEEFRLHVTTIKEKN